MKSVSMILAAAAIAAVSAAPASARHLKRVHPAPMAAAVQDSIPAPGGYNSGPDPYGVYFGNRMVGRDPDPNVRRRLQSDYSYLYSW